MDATRDVMKTLCCQKEKEKEGGIVRDRDAIMRSGQKTGLGHTDNTYREKQLSGHTHFFIGKI